jgi:hypothetical protein
MNASADPFHARAVIATAQGNGPAFERYFGKRPDRSVFVFDEGRTALDACVRLRPRHVFCDTTALSDGVTGYRLTMRLRALHRDGPMPSLYLFGEPAKARDKRALLDSLGIEKVLPPTPVVVAWILGDLPPSDSARTARALEAPAASAPAPEPDAAESVFAPSAGLDPARVEACNALLHRVLGPIAAKIIARAARCDGPPDRDAWAYAGRLAAEIALAEPRDEFLAAARKLRR